MVAKIGTPLEVHVTAEHIRNGKKFKCNECPVALALVAAGFAPYAAATQSRFFGYTEDPRKGGPDPVIAADPPREAQHWIGNFDAGGGPDVIGLGSKVGALSFTITPYSASAPHPKFAQLAK